MAERDEGGTTYRDPPTLRAAYGGDTRGGRLSVTVEVLSDARESGWDAVFGPELDGASTEDLAPLSGFPSLFAQVEPDGRGYQNWLGWIQLVNEHDLEGRSGSAEHDPIWFLQGRDIPYCSLGYAPSFFDAPTRPERAATFWEADLFLCTVPILASDGAPARAEVAPLVGVRWGFRIDTDGAAPTLLPTRWTGDWAWASWVPVLRRRFPTWNFAEETPAGSRSVAPSR